RAVSVSYFGTTMQQQVPPEMLARVSSLPTFPAYGGALGTGRPLARPGPARGNCFLAAPRSTANAASRAATVITTATGRTWARSGAGVNATRPNATATPPAARASAAATRAARRARRTRRAGPPG